MGVLRLNGVCIYSLQASSSACRCEKLSSGDNADSLGEAAINISWKFRHFTNGDRSELSEGSPPNYFTHSLVLSQHLEERSQSIEPQAKVDGGDLKRE